MVMKNVKKEDGGSFGGSSGGGSGNLDKHKTKIIFGVIAVLILGSIIWQSFQ